MAVFPQKDIFFGTPCMYNPLIQTHKCLPFILFLLQSLILSRYVLAELVELRGGAGAPVYECCHGDQGPHSDQEVPDNTQEVE